MMIANLLYPVVDLLLATVIGHVIVVLHVVVSDVHHRTFMICDLLVSIFSKSTARQQSFIYFDGKGEETF